MKQKLKNTTNYISHEKNDLTCQNICDIINQCGVSGVLSLDYKDLHIVFASKLHDDKGTFHHSSGQEDGISTIQKNMLSQEEINFRDEQLATLQLTDPLQYEELIAQRELVDP